MKTIKIIDLLNKIANGEKVPKEIRHNGFIYYRLWNNLVGFHFYKNDKIGNFLNQITASRELIEAVEIIEDSEEIEQIGSWYEVLQNESKETQYKELNHNFNVIFDRLESLINVVNKLDKKAE